ncbi:KGGVGR-motif variant AAA ATPase [Frankia sp. Cas4]|uniref:KGGVGR-motif variant AAA ATPase n=1 Tax=Frankia sp. Cas4 TaxID=3073927 RepID=UPI002AD564BA|nr:TIR domain-containing protein [Frankia sp. Cas4]
MPGKTDGKIVTFYSFKGGVGRSMCVAQVAWILASNGKKVLVVDWDLESPGLYHYFKPVLLQNGYSTDEISNRLGLLEAMTDLAPYISRVAEAGSLASKVLKSRRTDLQEAEGRARDSLARSCFAMSTDGLFDSDGAVLFILPAGMESKTDKDGNAYHARLAKLEWSSFYARGGNSFLKGVFEQLRTEYEYILIDSRTGYSGTAEACLHDFPNTVVFCFAMNNQNIDGTLRRANEIADLKGTIEILLLPTRVDGSDGLRLDAAQTFYRETFQALVQSSTLIPAAKQESYLEDVEIPYVPGLAFNEKLPRLPEVNSDESDPARLVTASCERLAGYLAGDTDIKLRIRNKTRWTQLSGREPWDPKTFSDIVLSSAFGDHNWADWVQWHLEERGFRVRRHHASRPDTDDLDTIWQDHLDKKVCLVALMSDEYQRSASADAAWQWFYRQRNVENRTVALLPVAVRHHDQIGLFARRRVATSLMARDENGARRELDTTLGEPAGGRAVNIAHRSSLAIFPGEMTTRPRRIGQSVPDLLVDDLEHSYAEGRYFLGTREEIDTAVQRLGQSADTAQKIGHTYAEARACLSLAVANLSQNDWAGAAASFRRANDCIALLEVDDTLAESIAESIGRAMEKMGDSPLRGNISGSLDDRRRTWGELEILRSTATYYAKKETRQHATAALGLLGVEPKEKARGNLALGLCFAREGNYGRARENLSFARDNSHESDPTTHFAALMALADTVQDGESSEKYYQDAAGAAVGDSQRIIAYVKLGDFAKHRDDNDYRAYYEQAIGVGGGKILISTYLLRALQETWPRAPKPDVPQPRSAKPTEEDAKHENTYIDHALKIISISRELEVEEASRQQNMLVSRLSNRVDRIEIIKTRLGTLKTPNGRAVKEFFEEAFGQARQ